MDYFWGSVKIMLIVYGLAAVISFAVAWIMKLIFAGIEMSRAKPGAQGAAPVKAPIEPGAAALERKA